MKNRHLFTVAVLMAIGIGGAATAQRPVGDTIRGRVADYYYNDLTLYDNWFTESEDTFFWDVHTADIYYGQTPCLPIRPGDLWHGDGNQIVGQQMYTDRPLKIVGCAACAFMPKAWDTVLDQDFERFYIHPTIEEIYNMRRPFPGFYFPDVWDTVIAHRATDSLMIYKNRNGQMVQLTSGPWRIEQPHRYMHVPYSYSWFCRNSGLPAPWTCQYDTPDSVMWYFDQYNIYPVYETFFKPVVVTDSFIVAGTMYNNSRTLDTAYAYGGSEGEQRPGRPGLMWMLDHQPTRYVHVWYCHSPAVDSGNVIWHKQVSCPEWRRNIAYWPGTASTNITNLCELHVLGPYTHGSLLIFPIIDPDFDTVMCQDAYNIRVGGRSGNSATLIWDSHDAGPWEVAYGKYTDRWEDYQHITTSSPTATLTGLEVGVTYFAVLRSYCYLTEEYGDWSSPIEVEVYQNNNTTGIDTPESGDRLAWLSPNPATAKTTVTSAHELASVAIYDMGGRKVMETEATGLSTEIDLRGLPEGSYIVAIRTTNGIATRRLAVTGAK